MKLTYKDYKDILKFYKIDISTLKRSDIKEKAEHLLATKLCKCIKSIKSIKANKNIISTSAASREKRAIAICYNSVIRKKGLKTFRFNCKKGARLLSKKGTQKLKVIKSIYV
jgi:hypothetical protein